MPVLMDRETVASIFTMELAIETAHAAFRALALGQAVMPPRLVTPITEHAGTQLCMPCYLRADDLEVLSVKTVTVFMRNPQDLGIPATLASLSLFDPRSGELLALMDAEYLTAMRTAAASAVATRLLACPDASVMTLFGTGAQAEAHLEAMLAVRPIRQVRVVGRDRVKAADFARRLSAKYAVAVEFAEDLEAAVRASQIVCTATNATTPLFDRSALQPGTHINAIGAFRPNMRELDAHTVQGARVYVDCLSAAREGAGDLLQAEAEGRFSWSDLAGELGDLLLGKVAGRADASEVTLFKSVGLAVQDACAAERIYRTAVMGGRGEPFTLA